MEDPKKDDSWLSSRQDFLRAPDVENPKFLDIGVGQNELVVPRTQVPRRLLLGILGALGIVALWRHGNIPGLLGRTCQSSMTSPKHHHHLSYPTRPLEWGDINFLHTTDSHGWLLGHQKASSPEPNGSATLGDFYSFVFHMKRKAANKGVDLLIVDSGDQHDGNGLSDGFPIGGVDGHETNKVFAEVPYDVLAIGNHELYKYDIALDVHKNFAPKWSGRYLTSNVNITTFDDDGNHKTIPLGDRYTKFTTLQGRKVTALGVLYDFIYNAPNTYVQSPESLILEPWFQEAIEESPDFFLLVGHMSVGFGTWPVVFEAVRKRHPFTPIFVFGGHSHVRDCKMLDGRSMVLASGRYMETVGWMSSSLDPDYINNLTMSRRYLDANRYTYQFHSETTPTSFDTVKGLEMNENLHKIVRKFKLNDVYGTSPQDYYLERYPVESESSIVNLLINKAIPTVLPVVNQARSSIPYILILNSGAARFDIFKGPFTRNDQLVATPFTGSFLYLQVPLSVAKHVYSKLAEYGSFLHSAANGDLKELDADMAGIAEAAALGPTSWTKWRQDQWDLWRDSPRNNMTLGYITTDTCPGDGDDTPHAPIPFHKAPDYVTYNTTESSLADDTLVDLIFVRFFAKDVVRAINELSTDKGIPINGSRNVTLDDIVTYSDLQTNQILGLYAQLAWN